MKNLIAIKSILPQLGKTTFIYNFTQAITKICDSNFKILILCLNNNHSEILNLFNFKLEEGMSLHKASLWYKYNTEIDLIKLMAKKDNIHLMGFNVIHDKARDSSDDYCRLLTFLKEKFDLILVDTPNFETLLVRNILNFCDFSINFINQDLNFLEMANQKTKEDLFSLITGNELFYVINKYSKNISNNSKVIATKYKLEKIYTLPYCEKMQEMKNKGEIEFYNFEKTEYNEKISEIANFIIDKFSFQRKEIKTTNKSFLERIIKKSS